MHLPPFKNACLLAAFLLWATLAMESRSDFVEPTSFSDQLLPPSSLLLEVSGTAALAPGDSTTFTFPDQAVLTIEALVAPPLVGYTTFVFSIMPVDSKEIGAEELHFTSDDDFAQTSTPPDVLTLFLDQALAVGNADQDSHLLFKENEVFNVTSLESDTTSDVHALFVPNDTVTAQTSIAQIVLRDGESANALIDLAVRQNGQTVAQADFNIDFVAVPEASTTLIWTLVSFVFASRYVPSRRTHVFARQSLPLSETSPAQRSG